jgi:hypothetical protein
MLSCGLRKPQPSRPAAPPKPAPAPPPSWLPFAAAALACAALLGVFSTEMADPDAWWHLRTGQYIVAEHRLPTPDPFSWTTAAAPPGYPGEESTRRFNLTHEWLAQVLLFSIWSIGGFAGLVLWKAFLLTLCCGLTGWIAGRRTGSWLWGLAATAATASLAVLFTADRPALITFALVPLFLAVFESGRRLWLLPVLAVFWSNCHGGFFLGWVVSFAYSAEALLRRSPGARRIVAWSAAAVLASGLNPNFFAVVPTLVLYRQSFLTSTLIEWSKPYLWGPPYAFDLLLYAAAAALALSWRRVRIADWILFALFAAAALSAFRNIILIAVVAPILIATYFPCRRALPPLAGYAALAAAAAVLVWGAAQGRFFQLRAAEWRYPSGAVEFLRKHGVPARIFNTYEYGGYLIWRGIPTFIDGRALSETVYQDYQRILNAPPPDPIRAAVLAKYGIGAMLVNSYEYNSGTLYPLVLALLDARLPEWKLAYEDAQSMVFLRELPPGAVELPRLRAVDHLFAECELHVERDPEFSLCARDLGFRFLQFGDRERARRALSLYVAHPYTDDPEARKAYQKLMSGK